MSAGRLVLGIGLIVGGVLALLDLQGVVDAGEVAGRWWPVLLVALGAVRLVADPGGRTGSIVLVVIGLVLLAGTLDLVGSSVWSFVGPAILIAIGGALLLGRSQAGGERAQPMGEQSEAATGTISAVAVLGGRKVRSTARPFTRGEVTAILGSVELDLTGALPAPGATLAATVVLGGVDIVVPKGWVVEVSGTPLLGGWDNTTRRDAAAQDAPRLAVKAVLVLGGIEVRHPERWG